MSVPCRSGWSSGRPKYSAHRPLTKRSTPDGVAYHVNAGIMSSVVFRWLSSDSSMRSAPVLDCPEFHHWRVIAIVALAKSCRYRRLRWTPNCLLRTTSGFMLNPGQSKAGAGDERLDTAERVGS